MPSESNTSQPDIVASTSRVGQGASFSEPRLNITEGNKEPPRNHPHRPHDSGDTKEQPSAVVEEPDGQDLFDKQLDEFFDWLHSGSVIFVDKMEMD